MKKSLCEKYIDYEKNHCAKNNYEKKSLCEKKNYEKNHCVKNIIIVKKITVRKISFTENLNIESLKAA